MFREQVNKAELAEVASEFKRLLGIYAAEFPAAGNVLNRGCHVIDEAINGQIELRRNKGFFPEEFWEGGALFELSELSEACAQFNLLLRGAISVEGIKASVRAVEKQAESDEKEVRDESA